MLLAVPLGMLLGAVYFAALWWTIAPDRRWLSPVPVLVLSWLLRSALVLGVFTAVLWRGGVLALALVFVGFLVARSVGLMLVTRCALHRVRAPAAAGRSVTDALVAESAVHSSGRRA